MNRCTTSKTCKLNLDSNMNLCDDILVLHNRDVGGGGGGAGFFGKSVNPIWTGAQFLPAILLLAPLDFWTLRRL